MRRESSPVILDDQMRIATLGGVAVRLSAREGFDLAENLIRFATRRLIAEEMIDARRPARSRK